MKSNALPRQMQEWEGPSAVSSGDDTRRFTDLFVRHQSLVRAVIFQIAGEPGLSDLTQEAFIRIWKGLANFRGESELQSWIYRVAANVAIDALRSSRRRGETVEYGDSELYRDGRNNESDLANRQLVERGLSGLSDEHRTVIVLALIHERPLAEIAEILDISEGTVKSRLHYAKDSFRRILKESGA